MTSVELAKQAEVRREAIAKARTEGNRPKSPPGGGMRKGSHVTALKTKP